MRRIINFARGSSDSKKHWPVELLASRFAPLLAADKLIAGADSICPRRKCLILRLFPPSSGYFRDSAILDN